MDDKTVDEYLAKVHAARARYMLAPTAKVVDAAYAEYDEAHALWLLAQRAYDAARSAGQGEPNGH